MDDREGMNENSIEICNEYFTETSVRVEVTGDDETEHLLINHILV